MVAVNVGVNDAVPSPGTRSAEGTTKSGSAGEFVETVVVTVGAVTNVWNGTSPGKLVVPLLTVSVAPVMAIDCVLLSVQATGVVRKNLTSVSLPRIRRL